MYQNQSETYIIAEIGVNHGGDLELAKKMTLAAKESGADAVKFQTFTASTLVGNDVPKVKYQTLHTPKEESHYEMIRSLEFSRENHKAIFKYCDEIGIDFISTPYDPESARFLYEDLGCRIIKVASADLIDYFLHEYLASTECTVIISTGMATIEEVRETLNLYEGSKAKLKLLHCTSNYPCSLESLNLNNLVTLSKEFNLEVGYSDHSVGSMAAILSLPLGAKLIEKHFTLDKDLPGPDHKASCTPVELKELVDWVRKAEVALGSFEKTVQPEEEEMRKVSRKSLTLSQDVKAGDTVKREHLVAKRPGTGIPASELFNVIGMKYNNSFAQNKKLEWSNLEGR